LGKCGRPAHLERPAPQLYSNSLREPLRSGGAPPCGRQRPGRATACRLCRGFRREYGFQGIGLTPPRKTRAPLSLGVSQMARGPARIVLSIGLRIVGRPREKGVGVRSSKAAPSGGLGRPALRRCKRRAPSNPGRQRRTEQRCQRGKPHPHASRARLFFLPSFVVFHGPS
jgi:hypothetical protein